LVFRPNRKRLIGVKWIYKEKKNVKEEVERYKAKLVTKAIVKSMRLTMMRFLLLSRLETIRLIIAIVAQHGWRIYQIDVKSTFLNDFLEEKVYIE
jgi:hypothetical protein